MLGVRSVGNGFIAKDIFQIKLVLTFGVKKNQKNYNMAIILIL